MPDLVVLAGLPGVGKSTVARALASDAGLLWLRADAIEQAMRESHMICDDLADGGYAAMRAVAEGALQHGIGVVADAVNPLEITRAPWRRLAARRGRPLVAVDLMCSDPDVHRARVEGRAADVAGLTLPDWAAVQAREYEPWAGALCLDTARLWVEAAVAAIRNEMGREE